MRESWSVASGGDIFHLSSEKCTVHDQPSDFPCVELDCLSQGTGEIIGTVDISKLKGVRNRFSRGQILYGKLRPYLNKYGRPDFDGACSTEIWVLNTRDKTKLLQDFLFYLVQSKDFRVATCIMAGTKMPRASWDVIATTDFTLPPLEEQERIAEILSDADAAIATAERLLKNEQSVSHTLLSQLLRHISKKTKPIGQLIDIQKGKPVSIDENGDGYPYIGSTSFDGQFSEFTNDTSGIPCKKTDVLLLWDGANAGKATTGHAGIVGSTVARLRPIHGNNSEFLYGVLSENFRRIQLLREGSGIPHLPKDFLSRFQIPVVSAEKQSEIASLIILQREQKFLLEAQITALKKQKRGLIQQLLTGKLRIPPNNGVKI